MNRSSPNMRKRSNTGATIAVSTKIEPDSQFFFLQFIITTLATLTNWAYQINRHPSEITLV